MLLTFACRRVATVEPCGETLAFPGPHQEVSGLTAVPDPGPDTKLRGGQDRVGRLLRTTAGQRLWGGHTGSQRSHGGGGEGIRSVMLGHNGLVMENRD